MRPSLLIILMDFLVSSLLLYVTDASLPGRRTALTGGGQTISRPASQTTGQAHGLAGDLSPELAARLASLDATREKEYADLLQRHLQQGEDARLEAERREALRREAILRRETEARLQAEEAKARLEQEAQAVGKDLEALRRELAVREQDLAAQAEAARRLKAQTDSQQQELAEKQALQDQLTAALLERAKELDARRDEAEALQRQAQASREEALQLKAQAEALDQQRAAVQRELAQANATLTALAQEKQSLAQEKSALLQDKTALEQQYRELTVRQGEAMGDLAAGMESLQGGQRELRESLGQFQVQLQAQLQEQLQTQLQALPAAVQQMLAPALAEVQRTEQQQRTLLEDIRRQLQQRDPALVARLEKQVVDAGKKMDRRMETLQRLAQEGNATAAQMQGLLEGLRQDAESLRQTQADAAAKAAASLGQRDTVHARVQAARVSLAGVLVESDSFGKDDMLHLAAYAMQVEGGALVAHAATLGLYWSEIDGDLASVRIAWRREGGTPASGVLSSAASLRAACPVTRALMPAAAATGSALALYDSLQAVFTQAQGQLMLFRRDNPVGSLDIAGIQRHEAATNLLHLSFPPGQGQPPQVGDYVVTRDGHLVGVMRDASTCWPILRGTLADTGQEFALQSPDLLSIQAGEFKRACPEK